MNNLIIRAASGVVYVALILFCLFMGEGWTYGLLSIFALMGMIELQCLLSHNANICYSARVVDILAALAFMLLAYEFGSGLSVDLFIYALITAIIYLPLRMIIATLDKSEHPAKSTLYSTFSLFYIALPLAMLLLAYIIKKELVIATFAFIWINDTGAYLAGISMGRHRLCERLSPKKSWEGFWGGFILSLAAGCVAALILGSCTVRGYVMWMGFAAAVSVLGTFGDLFESLVKRTLGVKDSGRIIPGHGGILDRIDSLIAVAPVALIFAMLFF